MKTAKEDVSSITSLKSILETIKTNLINQANLKAKKKSLTGEIKPKPMIKNITGIQELMMDLNGDNIEFVFSLVEGESQIIYPEKVTLDSEKTSYLLVYYQFDDTEKQVIEICLNKKDIENTIKIRFSPLKESMVVGIQDGKIHILSSKDKVLKMNRQMNN